MNPANFLASLLPGRLITDLWILVVDYCRAGDHPVTNPSKFDKDFDLAFAASLGYRVSVVKKIQRLLIDNPEGFPLTVTTLNPWTLEELTGPRYRMTGKKRKRQGFGGLKLWKLDDVVLGGNPTSWLRSTISTQCIQENFRETITTIQHYYDHAEMSTHVKQKLFVVILFLKNL